MGKENKKKSTTATTNNGIQFFTAGLFLGCITGFGNWSVTIEGIKHKSLFYFLYLEYIFQL